MVQISSSRSVLVYHMFWASFTRFSHWTVLGDINYFIGYTSHSHPLIFLVLRHMCPLALFIFRRHNTSSTSIYDGALSSIWNGATWIGIGLPRGGGSSH